MSITLRDDLGSNKVSSLYRRKKSRVIEVSEWNELIESEELIDENNWGTGSWREIVRSCPLNALDDNYSSLAGVDRQNQGAVDLFQRASANDPRYALLGDICSDTSAGHTPGMRAGVVVFCRFRGTIESLKKWGEQNGHAVFTLNEPEDPQQSNSSWVRQAIDKRKDKLYKAAKSSLDTSKLTLLVCGENATVGLNMPWATHAVHWDLTYGAVENIAQKTWRLDRRWDGAPDIAQDFYVTHFVFEDNMPRSTDDANQRFRMNRVLLGDRRYLVQGLQPPMFTDPTQGFVADVWSTDPRGLHLCSQQAQWIWDWANGNVSDNSGIGEAFWLHALSAITGLMLDLEDPIFSMKIDPQGNLGISDADLHDIITLASPEERPSLQILTGGYSNNVSVMTSFGIPTLDATKKLLNILPSGRLASKFTHFLREQPRGDVYPFVIEDDEESKRYAAHLGILEMIEDPVYAHLKLLHGPECPSGLMVREGSGKWEHVTISRLADHEAVFEFVLDHASKLLYPYLVPRYDPFQDDLEAFEDLDDYRELANPFANASALARCNLDSVTALQQYYMTVRPQRPEDMVPLINVFSKTEKREPCCPACGGVLPCDGPECSKWEECPGPTEVGWC